MTLGILARADEGGLGSLTWEVSRHLHPAKTLVVFASHVGRGRSDMSRYRSGEVRVCPVGPTAQKMAWLSHGCSTLWTAETWYRPSPALTRDNRTVLYAMPEFYELSEVADEVYVPTSWRTDLISMPVTELAFPVNLDVLPARDLAAGRTMYHVASNAFHDRNGTELLLEAVEHLRSPTRLLIRNPFDRRGYERRGMCEVQWIGHHHGPYYEAWPETALFVLPRRFGGLSLPMAEAAALRIPTVTLDLDPLNEWMPAAGMVEARVEVEDVAVKGGSIDIYGASPVLLAERIEELLSDRTLAGQVADTMRAHAEALSWDGPLGTRWRELLA